LHVSVQGVLAPINASHAGRAGDGNAGLWPRRINQ
jgi:hypothetical protein